MDTQPELMRKVMQEGKGYKEYLERLWKLRVGETIPLPTPSSRTNIAGTGTLVQGGSETSDFQARYDGTATSLTARTPYFSVPISSDATEESLDDACLESMDNTQSSQESQNI